MNTEQTNRLKSFVARHPDLCQFSKFCLVGAAGAVVDFGVYLLLNRVFGLHYMAATAISVFLAIVNNFIWNKYWTFKKGKSGKGYRESVKFFLVSLVNYFLNLGIFYAIINYTALDKIIGSYEDLLAKVIAIGLVMISNYFGNKLWTFR